MTKYRLYTLNTGDIGIFKTLKDVRKYIQSFYMIEETKVILHGNSKYRYFEHYEVFKE